MISTIILLTVLTIFSLLLLMVAIDNKSIGLGISFLLSLVCILIIIFIKPSKSIKVHPSDLKVIETQNSYIVEFSRLTEVYNKGEYGPFTTNDLYITEQRNLVNLIIRYDIDFIKK